MGPMYVMSKKKKKKKVLGSVLLDCEHRELGSAGRVVVVVAKENDVLTLD